MKRLQFLLWILLALPIGMLAQGSTWKTATAISNGNSGNGTLDKDTKDAWFKIDVPEEGTVTLTITVQPGTVTGFSSETSGTFNVLGYIKVGGKDNATDSKTITCTISSMESDKPVFLCTSA